MAWSCTPSAAASYDSAPAGDGAVASEQCVQEATETSFEDASASAHECGMPIEVLQERTEFNTTYAKPDGTTQVVASSVAVRARDGDGWVDVDNSLVPGADGLEVAAAVAPMTFSDGSDGQPLATIERAGAVLTFDVPFDLPAPSVRGGQLEYEQVLPGVDLILTVSEDTTSFSEVLRVNSQEAADDPRLDELRFAVDGSSGLRVVQDGDGFKVKDSAGRTTFTGPPPTMWDSREVGGVTNGPDRAGIDPDEQRSQRVVAPIGGEKVRAMDLEADLDGITVAPDQQMLQDPSTVWPVYIDPSVSGTTLEWTAIRDGYGQAYKFSPDAGLGLCNVRLATSCGKTHKSRLLWEFGGLGAVMNAAPEDIISATFAAVGTHSYSCTARPVALWRVGTWDGNTAWPASFQVPQSTQTVAHKSTCSGQPVRWIEWPALEAARAVAAGTSTDVALGLTVDESSMDHWKRYRSDATLSIVYNRPPNLATQVQFVDPAAPCVTGPSRPVLRTATPMITGVHTDPDGGSLRAAVDVNLLSSPVGANNLFHGNTLPQANTTWHDIRLGGMANGGVYRAKLWTVDDRPQSSGSVFCEMEIDTQPPNLPTVGAVAVGSQPVYAEGVDAGGVGRTGSFKLGNGGSTDVVSYKYGFSPDVLSTTVMGAAPTITVTPTRPGLMTLYVAAVDRAGWTGPARAYDVRVAWPKKVTWKLDEPSGGTSASVLSDGSNGLPISVSASMATRVDGFLAETAGSTTDKALYFDSSEDLAHTRASAIDTTASFTVSAAVRPDVVTGTATAVSQSGVNTANMQLGYRPCADTSGRSCWAFSMAATDSAAEPTTVVSTVLVEPGKWAYVTGVHDTGAGTLRVWTCTPTKDEFGVDDWSLTASGATPFSSRWASAGWLRLGRAHGPVTAAWSGAISEVRVADGVLSEAEIRTTCPPAA